MSVYEREDRRRRRSARTRGCGRPPAGQPASGEAPQRGEPAPSRPRLAGRPAGGRPRRSPGTARGGSGWSIEPSGWSIEPSGVLIRAVFTGPFDGFCAPAPAPSRHFGRAAGFRQKVACKLGSAAIDKWFQRFLKARAGRKLRQGFVGEFCKSRLRKKGSKEV